MVKVGSSRSLEFTEFETAELTSAKGKLRQLEFALGTFVHGQNECFCIQIRDIAHFNHAKKQVANGIQVQKVLANLHNLRQNDLSLVEKLHAALTSLLVLPWVNVNKSRAIACYLSSDGDKPVIHDVNFGFSTDDLQRIKHLDCYERDGLGYIHDALKDAYWFVLKIAGDKNLGYIVLPGRPTLLDCSDNYAQFRLLLCTLAMLVRDHQTNSRIARLSKAIEQSPAGVVMTNADGTIQYVNQAVLTMTGYSYEEIIGQNPRILKSGLTSDSQYENLWQTIKAGKIWRGEIQNRRKDGHTYWEHMLIAPVEDIGIYREETNFIAVKENVDQRKLDEQRLLHMATHDPLTDLANRHLIFERLVSVLASTKLGDHGVALLLLDLDHFNLVNDQQGHLVGDELLKQLAKRLQTGDWLADTIGRQSGDEFVMVLPKIKSVEEVQKTVDSILHVVTQPYEIGDFTTQLHCSIGIAMCQCGETSAEDLYRKADIAMHQAKKVRGNSSRIFTQDMDDYLNTRIWFRSAIKQAQAENELVLYYQPQLSMKTGHLIGAEALLRWFHPDKGSISPGEFIPIAEESGSVRDIGEWVINTVCRQLQNWLADGITPPRIAINLSASHLADQRLPAKILSCLQAYDVPPELLEVELTESAIMQSPELSIRVFNANQ